MNRRTPPRPTRFPGSKIADELQILKLTAQDQTGANLILMGEAVKLS